MASHEYRESESDIDDCIFCLLELLFISCRYENQPSCIDDKDDTEKHDKTIHIREDISEYLERSFELFFTHHTVSPCQPVRIFTRC